MNGPTTMLRIMPREMRMMTERVLSLTALPPGWVLMATDIVMYSQKLSLGGFGLLEKRLPLLEHADPTRMRIAAEDGAELRLDAADQHGWIVALTLVDLLGELSARYGRARITVSNAVDPGELAIAIPVAARAGLSVGLENCEGQPVLTARPARLRGELVHDEPLLWELMSQGVLIEAALWWRIYLLAQKALTPDDPVSRRHAGPLIVNEDGTVIGRKDNDDETDIAFLTSTTDRQSREGSPQT